MSTCNGARPEKFNYHVFAAYNEKNAPVVRLILEHLRNANLRVCDPASELIPGIFLLKSHGSVKSLVFFLSKMTKYTSSRLH